MVKKEFVYRGKTLDELKRMSMEEIMVLLPARERRKMRRGFTEQEKKLLEKIAKGKTKVRTQCRDMIVLPNMVGLNIGIYNGKTFVETAIVPEMIGYRLGELSMTRRRVMHHAPGIGATKSSAALSVR
jgi:small subunit ribosomal protein S19